VAKKKLILLVMKDQEGIEWVNAEVSETQAKKIVMGYKTSGQALRAEYKMVA